MEKIRAAIVGYGNIGRYVVEALESASDFEIVGIVRRDASNVPSEIAHLKVVSDISMLNSVDVAILCTPSRKVEESGEKILAMGISTVDSYDIHGGITDLRGRFDVIAKAHGSVAVLSAGWD
ncbi:MAG: Gfo/Idh/MocA family oxidoreductase, partial [Rikenellaceae bacterium]